MSRSLFHRWMKKGLVYLLLVVITSAASLVLLPAHELSFILIKNKQLESAPGQRVIIVGGSNVLYGQDSEQMASLLHRTVINDGLIAPIGLRVILNYLVPFIHPGDVIVISPEYEHFYDGLEGYNEYLAQLLDVYPRAIESFETPQITRLPDILVRMVREKFQSHIFFSFSHSEVKVNRFGDVIIPPGMISLPNIMNSGLIGDSGQSFNPAVVDVLNRFARQVKAKGATVVLVYPATRKTNYAATPINYEQFDTYLRNHLEFPVLEHPIDARFADEYFYNSPFHLNTVGRELRTRQLAELLINQGIVKVNPGESLPGK